MLGYQGALVAHHVRADCSGSIRGSSRNDSNSRLAFSLRDSLVDSFEACCSETIVLYVLLSDIALPEADTDE